MSLTVKKVAKFYVACVLLVPVAYVVVPLLLIRYSRQWQLPQVAFFGQQYMGLVVTIAGLVLFPYCTGVFFKHGKRTPLFTESQGHFFTNGLYGYTRNPMYVGHILVILGVFVWTGYYLLLGYSILTWFILHLYLIAIEEPQLKKRYGADYESYLRAVPRWIGF
jgi:protein-S-isoprenylcysteine O-methyltransferase Ste14